MPTSWNFNWKAYKKSLLATESLLLTWLLGETQIALMHNLVSTWTKFNNTNNIHVPMRISWETTVLYFYTSTLCNYIITAMTFWEQWHMTSVWRIYNNSINIFKKIENFIPIWERKRSLPNLLIGCCRSFSASGLFETTRPRPIREMLVSAIRDHVMPKWEGIDIGQTAKWHPFHTITLLNTQQNENTLSHCMM